MRWIVRAFISGSIPGNPRRGALRAEDAGRYARPRPYVVGVLARTVRAEAISLSTREFVLAERALGVTPTRIVFRHGLPNLYRPFLATAGPTIAGAILAEAALAT